MNPWYKPESQKDATIARLNARVEELANERDQWKTACHAVVSGDYRALSYLKSIALNHAEAARSGVVSAIQTLEEPASKYVTDLSAAEAALRKAREALQLLGNVNSWTDPTGPSGEWVIDVCRAALSPTPAPQPVEEGGEGRCPHGNTADQWCLICSPPEGQNAVPPPPAEKCPDCGGSRKTIICCTCGIQKGGQHKPSCQRQGIVTDESAWDNLRSEVRCPACVDNRGSR